MEKKLSKKTIALFVAAVVLLVGSGVGGTRAALTYFSETYAAHMEIYDIGVTLMERNDADEAWDVQEHGVSYRNYTGSDDVWNENTGRLTLNLLGDDEKLKVGKTYTENLAVTNSGSIDQYVRVKVLKYWTNGTCDHLVKDGNYQDGDKMTGLSPAFIDLHYVTGNGWSIDPDSTTSERTILYYNAILPGSDTTEDLTQRTTPLFADTLRIDDAVAKKVSETEEDGVITTTYDYNGAKFIIEAEVDAVQTHNAAAAIKSAWGVDVTVDSSTGALTYPWE